MELDPSRWLVALAGFFYDWMITREWKRVFAGFLPLLLMGTVVAVVWVGSQQDRGRLASWYMELGDSETATGAELNQLASSATDNTANDASNSNAGNSGQVDDAASGDATTEGSPTEKEAEASKEQGNIPEFSRFAETLFRRVQLLEPTKRSQYVIGATLAQRGALKQATRLLTEIAPDEQGRAGYAPAHCLLFLVHWPEFVKAPSTELLRRLDHHALSGSLWDRAPTAVLVHASDARRRSKEGQSESDSLALFEKAAQEEPRLYIDLARRANQAQAQQKRDDAIAKATKYIEGRLTENPRDAEARIMQAEVAVLKGSWKAQASADRESALRESALVEAGEILEKGITLEAEPRLLRALSEVYRQRFVETLRTGDRKSAQIGLLDMAMRTDPTNSKVAEQVALLARVGGAKPSQELITMLQEFLAEGKATATTHAWISEVYLLRGDFDKAIPHLEQVVTRLPNASAQLNNLAFVIADRYPARLEEALEYAQRSIASTKNQPNANYYDTLGIVLAKLGRSREAIAAFESAISLESMREDFHKNVAEQYRKEGDESMAAIHENMINKIKEARAKKEAEIPSNEPLPLPAENTPVTPDPNASQPKDSAPAGAE